MDKTEISNFVYGIANANLTRYVYKVFLKSPVSETVRKSAGRELLSETDIIIAPQRRHAAFTTSSVHILQRIPRIF